MNVSEFFSRKKKLVIGWLVDWPLQLSLSFIIFLEFEGRKSLNFCYNEIFMFRQLYKLFGKVFAVLFIFFNLIYFTKNNKKFDIFFMFNFIHSTGFRTVKINDTKCDRKKVLKK